MSSEPHPFPPRADAVLRATPTPVERFIVESLEPRRSELNEWKQLVGYQELLRRAANRSKLKPQRITKEDSGQLFTTLVHADGVAGGIGPVPRVTSLVSDQALRISGSRRLLRQYLADREVPLPEGRCFSGGEQVQATTYLRQLGQQAVVRSAETGTSGRATFGVDTRGLDQAWSRASATGNGAGHSAGDESGPGDVLIETLQPGIMLRMFVIGETVGAAQVHVPLYVVGDGESSIRDLLAAETAYRQTNEYLAGTLTADPDMLTREGLTEDSVLESGAVHVLASHPAPQLGSMTVDVTADVWDALKEIAIEAIWAVPGMDAAAVDVITPGLTAEDAAHATVVDVDPGASIEDFRYPAIGRMRMVHDALMRRVAELFAPE